ncbi:MAG: CsgG/HfaB family protein [Deltaproteobacteria bacterium]
MKASAHLLLIVASVAAPAANAATPRFAVLPFENASTDPKLAPLGKGLASMLATDLSQVTGFELVERQRIADIEAELDRGKAGKLSAKTAAKAGKLLGATHLVSGTFTVGGGTMRVDARLMMVRTGKVVLATSAEGERDAFFELEKTLVKKLIRAVRAKLTPKERRKIARVHTADFVAFKSFSEGLDLFDRKQYQAALEKLDAASATDREFSLARLTSGEYRRIVEDIRARADQIDGAQREVARLQLSGKQKEEAEIVDGLIRAAKSKRAGTQITALWLLSHAACATAFDAIERVRGRYGRERAAERFYRAYWAAAKKRWPLGPPGVACNRGLKLSAAGLADDLARYERELEAKTADLRMVLRGGYGLSDHALAPFMDRQQLALEHLAMVRARNAARKKKGWAPRGLGGVAKRLRGALLLDESTAVYRQLEARTTDPAALRKIASAIEANERLATALSDADVILREMIAERGQPFERRDLDQVRGDRVRLLRALGASRKLERLALVGGYPMWNEGGVQLVTGPRDDARRATSLRYFHAARANWPCGDDRHRFVVTEGRPRSSFTMRAKLGYTIPSDFEPICRVFLSRDTKLPAKYPVGDTVRVGLLFDVRDVAYSKRDTSGYGLFVARDEMVFGAFVRTTKARKTQVVVTPKARAALAARPDQVELTVRGTRVTARAGGATLEVTLSSPADGLTALTFLGEGFVELSDWSIAR